MLTVQKTSQKIENYEQAVKDNTQTWHCHHRAEILPCGIYSSGDLIKHHLYYQRPAAELILLTPSQHNALHNSAGGRGRNMGIKNKGHKRWLGRKHTLESRQKMSASQKGHPPTMKGKHLSEEAKQKLRANRLGKKLSAETKAKIGAKSTAANLRISKQISARFAGLVYWNNGIINKRSRECPGEGWARGRLSR